MKADTYAKLVVLEALIEAEIGYFLDHSPVSLELFREGMVARISDLVDEIDILDSVAAGRVYDAIVDFLAELPEEDPDGIVQATVHFRRAVDRVVARGMERRDLAVPSTWAVVVDELLGEVADEYHRAVVADGEVRAREMARAEALLSRTQRATERLLWTAEVDRPQIPDDMDRLVFAIRHRRLPPTDVDFIVRALQRRASRYRPAPLSSIGAFVLRQVLGSDRRSRTRVQGRAARSVAGDGADR